METQLDNDVKSFNLLEEKQTTMENVHCMNSCNDTQGSSNDGKLADYNLIPQNQGLQSILPCSRCTDEFNIQAVEFNYSKDSHAALKYSENQLFPKKQDVSHDVYVYVRQIIDEVLESICSLVDDSISAKEGKEYDDGINKNIICFKAGTIIETIETQVCDTNNVISTFDQMCLESNVVLPLTQSPSLYKNDSTLCYKIARYCEDGNFAETSLLAKQGDKYLENSDFGDAIKNNKASMLMVYQGTASEGYDRMINIDFSIIKDVLSSINSPKFVLGIILLQELSLSKKDVSKVDNNETIICIPEHDMQLNSALEMKQNSLGPHNYFQGNLNIVHGQCSKELVCQNKFGIVVDYKPESLNAPQHVVVANIFKDCLPTVINGPALLHSITNHSKVIQSTSYAATKKNTIKANKTLHLPKKSTKITMDQSNFISSFAAENSKKVISSSGKAITLFQSHRVISFTQRDQHFPSTHTCERVQNECDLNMSYRGVRKYMLEEINNVCIQPECSLGNSSSYAISENEGCFATLEEGNVTNCHGKIISSDLHPVISVKGSKKNLGKSVNFSWHNIPSSSKLQLHQNTKTAHIVGIENCNHTKGMQTLDINLLPSGVSSKSTEIVNKNETLNNLNEGISKPPEFQYFFDVSNSLWEDDDQVRGNSKVTKEIVVGNVEETGLIESKASNGNCFDDSTKYVEDEDDELDKAIDDSIKKYENFTKDVGISAIPSTDEKCCQTEMIEQDEHLGSVKRRLEFSNQTVEGIKKRKLDGHNDFSACPMLYNSNLNAEDNLGLGDDERVPVLGLIREHVVDGLNEYLSIFDESGSESRHRTCSSPSSMDWDQEVPIHLQPDGDSEDAELGDEFTDTESEDDGLGDELTDTESGSDRNEE